MSANSIIEPIKKIRQKRDCFHDRAYRSFEQLAPRWAKRIHKHGEHAFVKYARSIHNYSLCIVGESHIRNGGDRYYGGCAACDAYGYQFAYFDEPLRALPQFVRHFNEEHLARN